MPVGYYALRALRALPHELLQQLNQYLGELPFQFGQGYFDAKLTRLCDAQSGTLSLCILEL